MDKIEQCVSDVVAIANRPALIMSRQRRASRELLDNVGQPFGVAQKLRSTPGGL